MFQEFQDDGRSRTLGSLFSSELVGSSQAEDFGLPFAHLKFYPIAIIFQRGVGHYTCAATQSTVLYINYIKMAMSMRAVMISVHAGFGLSVNGYTNLTADQS